MEARALDARLDAHEAEENRQEQHAQRELTALREAALKESREETKRQKAALAMKSREAHQKSLQAHLEYAEQKRRQAEATRSENKALEQELQANERARLERAREIKRLQAQAKERAKKQRQAALEERLAQAARQERADYKVAAPAHTPTWPWPTASHVTPATPYHSPMLFTAALCLL